jgi:hypothetical protein
MKDLMAHLKRNNFMGLTAPKIAQRIRDLGGEPISLFCKITRHPMLENPMLYQAGCSV